MTLVKSRDIRKSDTVEPPVSSKIERSLPGGGCVQESKSSFRFNFPLVQTLCFQLQTIPKDKQKQILSGG